MGTSGSKYENERETGTSPQSSEDGHGFSFRDLTASRCGLAAVVPLRYAAAWVPASCGVGSEASLRAIPKRECSSPTEVPVATNLSPGPRRRGNFIVMPTPYRTDKEIAPALNRSFHYARLRKRRSLKKRREPEAITTNPDVRILDWAVIREIGHLLEIENWAALGNV